MQSFVYNGNCLTECASQAMRMLQDSKCFWTTVHYIVASSQTSTIQLARLAIIYIKEKKTNGKNSVVCRFSLLKCIFPLSSQQQKTKPTRVLCIHDAGVILTDLCTPCPFYCACALTGHKELSTYSY